LETLGHRPLKLGVSGPKETRPFPTGVATANLVVRGQMVCA